MALVLKLNRNTTDMSLLDGDTGAQLDVGWTPRIARPAYGSIPPYVTEQIPIRITDSSQDNLAAEIQELHQMQMWAEEYLRLRSTEYPVWLYSQLGAETNARRSYVRRIAAEFLDSWYGPQPINANPKLPLLLEVERHPYWESTTLGSAFTLANPGAAVSVTVDYTAGSAGDVAGDVPARLAYMSILPVGAGAALGRLWIGTRSANKHGTLANFVNHWECEDTDATLGTDAARATDATAHPGGAGNTKVTITPGTATWAKRLTIPLSAVTAHETDNFGTFLWLLRTKVSAGTWEVHLRWGYAGMDDANHLRGQIIEISETSWDIKEMGIAPIPLRDLQALGSGLVADSYEASYQIQVWARRTDGSGTLDLDCICPVPIDESWLIAKGFTCNVHDATTDQFIYSVAPSDRPWAGVWDGDEEAWSSPATISIDPTHLGLPPGDGRFIIVYATGTASSIADSIAASGGRRYDRWLSLRGAE